MEEIIFCMQREFQSAPELESQREQAAIHVPPAKKWPAEAGHRSLLRKYALALSLPMNQFLLLAEWAGNTLSMEYSPIITSTAVGLLWALGEALGLAFDRETRAAWDQFLSMISAVTLEGAAQARPHQSGV